MRASVAAVALALLALIGAAAPVGADLRITDLDVYLSGDAVTVHLAVLNAVPTAFTEGVQSGIPAHVRYTVELWQYNRLWRDQLMLSRVVERQLAYNVVTREFKVTSTKGERHAPYVTREMHDATRVLSEIHGLTLAPAAALDPAEIFYVRVYAESSLNGENTFIARLAGTAQQAARQSDVRPAFRAH